MAILNTPEFLGQKAIPAVRSAGEVVSVVIPVSNTILGATLGSTDTVNLMRIPANAVLLSISQQASATTTAKSGVGIVANTSSTSFTTKFTAATDTVQTTTVTTTNVGIMADAATALNDRILAVIFTTAALTQTLYIHVTYTAAR